MFLLNSKLIAQLMWTRNKTLTTREWCVISTSSRTGERNSPLSVFTGQSVDDRFTSHLVNGKEFCFLCYSVLFVLFTNNSYSRIDDPVTSQCARFTQIKTAVCLYWTEQVDQLSQTDRAAGWVSYGQKWKTGIGVQYLWTLSVHIQPLWRIWPSNQSNSVKNAK